MLKARTVDEYIALQPVEARETLERLRHLILSAAPKAEERISYGICCYMLDGMLVGFAATRKGYSFYLMSGSFMKRNEKLFPGITYANSAIHLPAGGKLPVTVLKKITRMRMKENAEKAALKKAKKKSGNAGQKKI